MPEQKKLLIISQVYVPDPAAVGQYMSDVAVALAGNNWQVTVLTANRGYDDPSIKYRRRELLNGVLVKRLPLSSFGKNSITIRLFASLLFIFQTVMHGITGGKLTAVLVSTSPPIAPLAAVIISAIKKAPVNYWVMDLNPDQAIELGIIAKNSFHVKNMNWLNRLILARAKKVITLDQFMAERINNKMAISEKIIIIPPWPHQEHLSQEVTTENPFRDKHFLNNKFIFMYSGNHTFTNPVTTFTRSALALQDEVDALFMFIGGGVAKPEIDALIRQTKPTNIRSLPYQPLDETKYSLAAADVHLVSVGEKVVGIVHPSKIYGAMAIGRPILLLGPEPCHASALVKDNRIGWHISHGDLEGAIKTIRAIIRTPRQELVEMGRRARKLAEDKYNRATLMKQFCATFENYH